MNTLKKFRLSNNLRESLKWLRKHSLPVVFLP